MKIIKKLAEMLSSLIKKLAGMLSSPAESGIFSYEDSIYNDLELYGNKGTDRKLARLEQILTCIVMSDKTRWKKYPEEGSLFAVIYVDEPGGKMTWLAFRTGGRFDLVGLDRTISTEEVLAWKAMPKTETKFKTRGFSKNDWLWFSQMLKRGLERNCVSRHIMDERTKWKFLPESVPEGKAGVIAYYGPLLRLGMGEYSGGRWLLYNGRNPSIVLNDCDIFAYKETLGDAPKTLG